MKQKGLGSKLLRLMLMMAMVIGLLPGMGVTAYAETKVIIRSQIDGDPVTVGEKIELPHDYTIKELLPQFLDGDRKATYVSITSDSAAIKGEQAGDDTIITVNGTGLITISLSYSYADNTYTKDATIGVFEIKDVTSINLSPSTAQTIGVNDKVSFTASVQPDDATDQKVIWRVDNAHVKLYSDRDCTEEVGDAATNFLEVYAKGESIGTATITVTSNADSSISASRNVTVNASSYSVTIPNITNGTVQSDKATASTGDTVTITATPATGYELDALTITPTSGDSIQPTKVNDTQYTFVMPAQNVNVQATFKKIAYDINITPSEQGSITLHTQENKAVAGTQVGVTITPAKGYGLTEVKVTDKTGANVALQDPSSSTYVRFIMPESAVTITATYYTKSEYDITVSAGEHGKIECGGKALEGENVVLEIKPDAGYECDEFTVKTSSGSDVTFERYGNDVGFAMPASAVIINATFKEATEYNLWIADSDGNKKQVTKDNKNDILGNNTISYDPFTTTLTLNGANITSSSNEVHGIEAKKLNLTIKGTGSITATGTKSCGIKIENGTLNLAGNNITATGSYYGIYTDHGITVSEGKINATGAYGVYVPTGSLNVVGGELEATGNGLIHPGISAGQGVNITGGKVHSKSTDDGGMAIYAQGPISIADSHWISSPEGAEVKLKDGVYYISLNNTNVKDAIIEPNPNPPAVASVTTSDGTTTEYEDLSQAVEAWTDGSTLKLLKDIQTENTIAVTNGTKTFDMNGHTLEVNADCAIRSSGTSNLTIKDFSENKNGVVQTSSTDLGTIVVRVADSATLTLDSGNIAHSSRGVYLDGTSTFNMNGGTIRVNNAAVSAHQSATFNMDNGTVVRASGESTPSDGLDIQNSVKANIRGGSVEGYPTGMSVAGFSADRPVVVMSGGSISGSINGVILKGLGEKLSFTMTGGSISGTGNNARSIYIDEDFKYTGSIFDVNILGGKIKGKFEVGKSTPNIVLKGGVYDADAKTSGVNPATGYEWKANTGADGAEYPYTISIKPYTVVFDKNCDDDVENMPDAVTATLHDQNYKADKPDNTPTREGYTFIMWQMSDLESPFFPDGKHSVIIPEGGLTAYAKWEETKSVHVTLVNTGHGTVYNDVVNALSNTIPGEHSEFTNFKKVGDDIEFDYIFPASKTNEQKIGELLLDVTLPFSAVSREPIKDGDAQLHTIGLTGKESSYEELREEREDKAPLGDSQTFYVLWNKPITEVTVSAKAPKCGVQPSGGRYEQTNRPEVTIPSGVNYTVDETDGKQDAAWIKDLNFEPFNEKFVGDRSYYYDVRLIPDFGYYFDSNLKVTANGEKATRYVELYGAIVTTVGKVTAEHNVSEWKVTKNSSDSAMGKEEGFCSGCGKTVTKEFKYSVVKGSGLTWTKGSSTNADFEIERSFRDEVTFGNTEKVAVDGNVLDAKNYDVKEGCLKLGLKAAYLNTLSVGDHTLKVMFKDGEVSTRFRVVNKSSGGGSTPKKDNVVTCQMAGFPANYAWNEAAKACQPGYIDAGGNFHPYKTVVRRYSPNTSDNGNLTMYVMAMFLMTFVAYITAKKLTEDSRA